jgi:hypothetical protein
MSRDLREGMDTFLNKRKPVWKGPLAALNYTSDHQRVHFIG